jgi:thymidylate synthase ThyX
MIEVKGKANIVARVIADSINEQGNRLTTWEVEYPRLIHSELMTHRMFSRNAASSRAIPFAKMVEQLNGIPVRFGKNQAGMQDEGEDFNAPVVFGENERSPESAWETAKDVAVVFAQRFAEAGYHKQITGRLTEPFQIMKTIISATEIANFFWLRDDKAADPTIAVLARVMKESYEQSVPELLKAGEYHLPYVDFYQEVVGFTDDDKSILGPKVYYVGDLLDETGQVITLEQAIKVSCARCAAVSYRNEGYGLEKSLEVYDRLLGSDKKHASAFEHVATPRKCAGFVEGTGFPCTVNQVRFPETWEPGISHADRDGNLWSGNFCGFIQYRKTIDGENYAPK